MKKVLTVALVLMVLFALTGSAMAEKTNVIVAAAAEPDSFFPFDPDKATNMDEVPIIHAIYETPVKLMPDGTVEPLLATMLEISEDGKEYKLTLRDDVYFHNGKKMTAEDVAASLNGAAATSAGRTLLINYDVTEVIDANTVVVKLTNPYAPFVNSLASRFALVIDKDYLDQVGIAGYQAAPVGTGPYTFVERISGDHITLKANEAYWGGVPTYKEVTYRVMSDANTQILALEAGEIDVLLNTSVTPLLRLPKNSSVKWASTEASSIAYMGLNCMKGPAADINFRKALQCGINKEDLIIGVYEGMAEPADIYMTKSFSGRPDDGTYKTVAYDFDKAKEHLVQSNYKGEEFVIATVSGTRNEVASQIIQGQLIELGINCTVNALDTASYFQFVHYGTGEYGGSIRAGGVSVLDADGIFTLFNSTQTAGQATSFRAFEPIPELDDLTARGRTETNLESRKALYARACDIITDEVLMINFYCDLSVVAYNEQIQGVVPRALTGLYYFYEWH